MSENRSHFTLYGKSPVLQLVITLLITIFVGGALFLILFIAGLLISGIDTNTLSENFMTEFIETNINFFRYLMIIQSISVLIIPSIMVRNMLLPEGQRSVNDFSLPKLNEIAIVVLLALCILPINGIIGELNAAMKFPDWLAGLEEWMRLKEDEAAELTRLLIPSDSAGVMFLNLFIIAVLPAISEELFFRGVLQRIFYGFFKSPHISIWVTAALFSAIHLQFYGFVPRLILGLSFGYLYYWGRTLWLPVIAHFVNNATAVVFEYFQGSETVSSIPDIEIWKTFLILPVPVFISVVILLYFRNKYKDEKEMPDEHPIEV
jgi:hypothetical protein